MLIWTIPGDMHAAAAWWALRQKGVTVLPASAASFPDRARLSLEYGDSLNTRFRESTITYNVTEIPVHWLRRLGRPAVKEHIASSDHEMALNEWKSALNSLRLIIASIGRFCVNPPHTYSTYAEKPYHLYLAKNIGLNIPKTLISSSSSDVRIFLDSVDKVVFKAMKPSIWKDQYNAIYEIYTTEISKSILKSQDNISLCPGIYQEFINKKCDVRITVMGKTVFALSITSGNEKEIDVRRNISRRFSRDVDLSCSIIDVPQEIIVKIFYFMKKLDLVFCTFDFVVDVNGKWYFLEANEMGQFLWMETMCPEIHAIDAFSEFMISENKDFIYNENKSKNMVNISDLMKKRFFDDYYEYFPHMECTDDFYTYE